jgi:SOS-response transcriptional repressor LexA
MTEAVRPTKKQRELLDYIDGFIKEHGYSPSYREIMNGCRYNSVATVALHVGSLIKRGHLVKRDHSARSLEVVQSSDTPKATSDKVHEDWLVSRIETYLFDRLKSSEESLETTPDPEEVQTLTDTMRLLGMAQRAEELELRLAGSQQATE